MRLLLTLISLPVFLSFSPASAQSLPGNIYWTPLSDNNDAHYIVTWFPNIEPSLQLWPPTQMTIAFMGVENFFWSDGAITLDDPVWGYGYNVYDLGGTRINPNLPSQKVQFEGNYLANTGNGDHMFTEWVYDYSPASPGATQDTVSWRPWAVYLDGGPVDGSAPSSAAMTFLLWSTRADEFAGRYGFLLSGNGVAEFGLPLGTSTQYRVGIFNDTSSAGPGFYSGEYSSVRPQTTTSALNAAYLGSQSEAIYEQATGGGDLGQVVGLQSAGIFRGSGMSPRTVEYLAGARAQVMMVPTGSTGLQQAKASYGLDIDTPYFDGATTYSGSYYGLNIRAGNGGTIPNGFGVQVWAAIHIPDQNPSAGNQLALGTARKDALMIEAQNGGSGSGYQGNLEMLGGTWNNGHIAFIDGGMGNPYFGTGKYHLYADDTSKVLRVTPGTGAPVSLASGNAVVTGSGVDGWGPLLWADGLNVTTGAQACANAGLACVANGVRTFAAPGSGLDCGTVNAVPFMAQCK